MNITIEDNTVRIRFNKNLPKDIDGKLVLIKCNDFTHIMYASYFNNEVCCPGIFFVDIESFKDVYNKRLFFVMPYNYQSDYPFEELWHYLGSLENPTIEEIDLIQNILNA